MNKFQALYKEVVNVMLVARRIKSTICSVCRLYTRATTQHISSIGLRSDYVTYASPFRVYKIRLKVYVFNSSFPCTVPLRWLLS